MRHLIGCLLICLLLPLQNTTAQIKVYGYVIETTTGEPVSDAVIFVTDEYNLSKYPTIRDTTDINGYYEIVVNNGTYHFGVYTDYEIIGEDFMMVYQPGIFSLPDSMNHFFLENGLNVDYGVSEIEFKNLFKLKYTPLDQNFDSTFSFTAKDYSAMELTKSRIRTNSPPFFKYAPISFIELKTW